MGINGLLVEHRRRQQPASFSQNHHFQQHASALRAQNATQLLTLQTGDALAAMPRRPASAGAGRSDRSNYSVIMRSKKVSYFGSIQTYPRVFSTQTTQLHQTALLPTTHQQVTTTIRRLAILHSRFRPNQSELQLRHSFWAMVTMLRLNS